MNEPHPIEVAWQRFLVRDDSKLLLSVTEQHRDLVRDLLQKYGPIVHKVHELIPSYLKIVGLESLPGEVILPSRLARNLIKAAESSERNEEEQTEIANWAYPLANTFHVWAAYRESKTIFEINPVPFGPATFPDFPERVLTRELRLLSHCPVFSMKDEENKRIFFAATYDLLLHDKGSFSLVLQFSSYSDGFWLPLSSLLLSGETLKQCMEKTSRSGGADAWILKDSPQWYFKISTTLLGLVLRMGREPDIIRVVEKGLIPEGQDGLPERDPDLSKDLTTPTIYAVEKDFRLEQ
jgi:hypothetical protein